MLYELCTLEKPFKADNLLGLVLKIVSGKQTPISASLPYSKALRKLIDMMLEKDPKLRPTMKEIIQMSSDEAKVTQHLTVQGKIKKK